MPANLENSAVAIGLEKVSFHSNPKEAQCQRMPKLPYNVLISHAGKVMPKILQARCQRCINQDLPDVQDGFWRSRGIRDQIVNVGWQKKQENSRKTSTSASLTTLKPLTVWIITICGKLLIPDHLACLLRNLYVSQEATVRTWHGTTHWFKTGKEVCQGCELPNRPSG